MHVVCNVKKLVLNFMARGQNINTPTPYSAVHVKNAVMKNNLSRRLIWSDKLNKK